MEGAQLLPGGGTNETTVGGVNGRRLLGEDELKWCGLTRRDAVQGLDAESMYQKEMWRSEADTMEKKLVTEAVCVGRGGGRGMYANVDGYLPVASMCKPHDRDAGDVNGRGT